MSELSAALDAVAALVAPVDGLEGRGDVGGDAGEESVLALLMEAVLKIKLGDEGADDDDDVRWRFVRRALSALLAVKRALAAPGMSDKDRLVSVKQQQQISTLLQLVCALGVVPNLIPGVGLDPGRRSVFFQALQQQRPVSAVAEDPERSYNRLVRCTDSLLDFLSDGFLSGAFLSKHLGDLLAALVQLGHAPLKKPEKKDQQDRDAGSGDGKRFVMTEEKFDRLTEDQSRFRRRLDELMDRVYQPLVVKFLLVVQSSGASKKDQKDSSSSSAPLWFRNACGSLLSGRLMRPDGVRNIIRGILDLGGLSDGAAVMRTQKHAAVASVLASPPRTGYKTLEHYYQHVCPQLLELIRPAKEGGEDEDSREVRAVCCQCVGALSERSLVLSRRHLFQPAMAPLLALAGGDGDEAELPTEEELSNCVSLLHELFVSSPADPSALFPSNLDPCLPVLLEMHCAICFGASHLRKPVKELLEKYLRSSSRSDAVAALRFFAFKEEGDDSKGEEEEQEAPWRRFRPPRPDVKFAAGSSGGVSAVSRRGEAEENFYVADDEKAIALADLLEAAPKEVALEVFMSLLQDLSALMGKGFASGAGMDERLAEAASESDDKNSMEARLLALDAELDRTMLDLRRQLMVIRMLGLLSEDEALQERLTKDSDRMLDFVGLTLQRAAIGCTRPPSDPKAEQQLDEEGPSSMLECQSVTMALTLLSLKATTPRESVSAAEWRRLAAFLPELRTLAARYPEERVRATAGRMTNLIATHGIITDSHDELKEKCAKLDAETEKVRRIARQARELAANSSGSSSGGRKKTGYAAAMHDLADPLLPVRGHALIQLTGLVEQGDKETLDNISKVMQIFQENLEDEDSYIYLSAINGLASCAAHRPEMVVDALTKEFAHVDDRPQFKDGGEGAMEARTKLGEALVRVTRILGETTPAYRDRLLNPFLAQLSHPDALVRASALSNLGEACKNLRFALGNILQEVLQCLQQCLSVDPALEVRRASVLVLTLLLQGLGRDAFRLLRDNLRDIWRTLTSLRRRETDEALLAHASLAVDEIDSIVRDLFRPDAAPQKTIYVLDAPPDPF